MVATGNLVRWFLSAPLIAAVTALAEPQIHQSVDRPEVGTEELFRLEIEVVDAPDDAEMQPAPLDDFEVLDEAKSTQVSLQLGFGTGSHQQKTTTITYVLRPNKVGTLTIGRAKLVTSKKTFSSEEVRIKSVSGKSSSAPSQPSRGTARRFPQIPGFPNIPGFDDDDFFGGPQRDRRARSDSDVLLRAELDKSQVYVGEQATLSVFLFARVPVSQFEVKPPKLDGFWSENITPMKLSKGRQVIDGVTYDSYLVTRRALFPTAAGTLTLDPTSLDVTVGDFFGWQRLTRTSEPLSLVVKALPPPNSTSNIGNWTLSADATQTQVKVGEPTHVRIILEGRGNFKHVHVPALTAPAGIKVYDPTIEDTPASHGESFGGTRVYDYVVIAQQTGSFELPPVELAYFDPTDASYKSVVTKPVGLLATLGGAQVTSAPVTEANSAAKNVIAGDQLRLLRPPGLASSGVTQLANKTLAWLAPWVLVGGAAVLRVAAAVRQRRKSQRPDITYLRTIRTLEERTSDGDDVDFSRQLVQSIHAYLQAVCAQPTLGLTAAQLERLLTARGTPSENVKELLVLLERCDAVRFSPAPLLGDARRALLKDAARLSSIFPPQ